MRGELIGLAVALKLVATAVNAEVDSEAVPCRPARVLDRIAFRTAAPPRQRPPSPHVRLTESGVWCLGESLVQSRLWDWHASSFKISNDDIGIVAFIADDVVLDLSGHAIENRWFPNGGSLTFLHRPDGSRVDGFVVSRITIRNGQMISPGRSGVAIDLVSMGPGGLRNTGRQEPWDSGAISPTAFERTSHRVENMVLAAGRHAIVIDGRDNVIRGNRIVVDGASAIVATGPDVVIEDNEIEVRAVQRSLDLADDPPFPIRLLHADRASVRNNRIRYTGGLRGTPSRAAIQLTRSRDVVIEGNRLDGIERSFEQDAESSVQPALSR